MTAILVRSPLADLSMASTQRQTTTRRRSARNAFANEDGLEQQQQQQQQQHHVDAPVAKKARKEVDSKAAGQVNGTTKASGRRAKAAAYEEDDDGFTFSRTRPKKATAKKAAPVDQEPVPPAPPTKAAKTTKATSKAIVDEQTHTEQSVKSAARRTRKSAVAAIAPAVAEEMGESAPKRRRSARLSGGRSDIQVQQQSQRQVLAPAPEKPKRARKSAVQQKDKPKTPRKDDEDGVALVGGEADAEQPSREGTKIALPFADTPIIKRNKEMRKGGGGGHRRSSTGLRGRRASSLIDSGTSNEVPTEDFYKHIEQNLPEPRRMKQLLTWCGTRALPEKPAGEVKDASAIMAARAIQQELLNDFASKSEMSNWFDREDVEPTVLVKKPNPRNEQNAARLEELEQEVKRLQEEKRGWDSLLKTPLLTSSSASASNSKDKEILPDATQPDTATDIDPGLLDDPEQTRILASLNSLSLDTASSSSAAGVPASATDSAPAIRPPSISQSELETRLQAITASLEPRIDLFADGLHKLMQYRAVAERVADSILASAADRLEEREKEAKKAAGTENIGTGDVLRALAGALAERK
ncbi:Mis12-Mtw1 protein family-domain-containing protein [Macrophomina phaseolina]|uniref:Mis12-Mtw1 protein family-domain-containing protein n=1 Tax=Macrophomina phaseolina TaxID=35725 RepID=A0ABQ8G2N8_9PEZI|nr:Mis12-Mtw1 protein family-domain-containing protein [Macrophomina phaseolina]